MSNSQVSPWNSLGTLGQFAPGSLTTVKLAPHQLVVARTAEGEIHVLDNRCPHEGYPLAQGDLKGCSLTCCWHNWKFDVRDGSCTLGGEGVRRFPSRVKDGEVLCDLTEPDPKLFFPAWKASLFEGMRRHDNGRAIRDGVRLLQGGYPARQLMVDIACYDARHAEYGTTHVLPLCADLTRVFERLDGVEAMNAVAQAIDLCGETNQRMPERERPQAIAGATLAELRRAVEEEEVERAEALLLGAFDSGIPLETIDHWMYACLADHFLGFGHPLIYLTKLHELSASSDRAAARELYGSLLYTAMFSTREDTLPYMHAYSSFLSEVDANLEAVAKSVRKDAPFEPTAFRDSILDDRGPKACATLWEALLAGVDPERIADALVGAAAHRLLRFDVSLDSNTEIAENWLSATHRLTFASAVRSALERCADTDAIRFLFQAVAFINSGRGMDEPPEQRVTDAVEDSDLEQLLVAVDAGDVELAVARTRGLLRSTGGFDALQIALEDRVLTDSSVRPIVVAHVIKTVFCALDEYARQKGQPDREVPLLAVIRMLASPVQERRVQQVVRNSIAWVSEGRMPRKLTQ